MKGGEVNDPKLRNRGTFGRIKDLIVITQFGIIFLFEKCKRKVIEVFKKKTEENLALQLKTR